MRGNLERLADLSVSENLHRAAPARQAMGSEHVGRDLRAGLEAIERREVHDVVFDAENVRETALGDAPVQRHLSPFESPHVLVSAPGLLPLAAAPRRLSVAASGPPPHALTRMGRAESRTQVLNSQGGRARGGYLRFWLR